MLHASQVAQKHASDVAELEFANNLIGVFVAALVMNNRYDVRARVQSLLSAVPAG
jgi:hypothetical protein